MTKRRPCPTSLSVSSRTRCKCRLTQGRNAIGTVVGSRPSPLHPCAKRLRLLLCVWRCMVGVTCRASGILRRGVGPSPSKRQTIWEGLRELMLGPMLWSGGRRLTQRCSKNGAADTPSSLRARGRQRQTPQHLVSWAQTPIFRRFARRDTTCRPCASCRKTLRFPNRRLCFALGRCVGWSNSSPRALCSSPTFPLVFVSPPMRRWRSFTMSSHDGGTSRQSCCATSPRCPRTDPIFGGRQRRSSS
mmetsp:Transcript_47155/g.111094  ORF Transcript_47155/g.111094 Transcript_47155/m.111094 type:complete len:245 (+) Transcript_47155:756-1490(+)